MAKFSVLADEHVPSVFTTTLRSNGFDVTAAQARYGQGSVDATILDDCENEGLVVLTNDRDFVRMADERPHAGVVIYTDRRFLLEEPIEAVEAFARIARHYTPDEMRNSVEWLDNWR